VTDPASIQAAVGTAVDRFGRIDVLVDNAGYGQLAVFEEITPGQIERPCATNGFGVPDVARAVLPTLRRQRSGHIVAIASISGIVGGARSTIDGASKFALTGWSEGLAEELQPLGMSVTVVYPGMFRTDRMDPSSVGHGADHRGLPRRGRRPAGVPGSEIMPNWAIRPGSGRRSRTWSPWPIRPCGWVWAAMRLPPSPNGPTSSPAA